VPDLNLPTTAPCAICSTEIILTTTQRYRALNNTQFCCNAEHRKLWQQQQATTREATKRLNQQQSERAPEQVACGICSVQFYPAYTTWLVHQRGNLQRYYCQTCVAMSAVERTKPTNRFGVTQQPEDPLRIEFRKLYFSLQEKDKLPILNIFRKVW